MKINLTEKMARIMRDNRGPDPEEIVNKIGKVHIIIDETLLMYQADLDYDVTDMVTTTRKLASVICSAIWHELNKLPADGIEENLNVRVEFYNQYGHTVKKHRIHIEGVAHCDQCADNISATSTDLVSLLLWDIVENRGEEWIVDFPAPFGKSENR